MKRPPRWLFFALPAAAIHIALGWAMIRASAPTFDEPVHLASGYTNLISGRFHLNILNHPPFAEMWAGLALVPLRPNAFFQNPDYYAGRIYTFGDYFLYKNRLTAETMLDAARLWCLASWSGLFACGIAAWSWRMGGGAAAVAALVLFVLSPALISNSALVTTDAASAVFFFLTFLFLGARARGRWSWAAAGACMALAMAAKFNMVILPGFVAVILLTERRVTAKAGGRADPAGMAIMAASALVTLAAVYRFEYLPLYWKGVVALFTLLDKGRASFFFGRHSLNGTWLYFPVALAIKTPIPALLAAGLGFFWCVGAPSVENLWLVAPALGYFLAACTSKTQIGYRHLLPIYPFLIILGGTAAARLWQKGRIGRAACLAGAAWLAAGVLFVHPHYLTYFNELAGGPARGYERLTDSNVDWGQGLKDLAVRLRSLGNPPVVLSYFGVADPSYYGIRYVPLGFYTLVDRREGVVEPSDSDRILLAVSATNLQSTYYANPETFAWLKGKTPLFVAANSIFVYDLSGDAGGVRSLGELLTLDGKADLARRLAARFSHGA